MSISIELTERFHRRYSKNPESGCWLWIGSLLKGYGQIKDLGRVRTAHRLSWEIHRGAIPEGLWILHRCDVPNCVNPDHLFVGTAKENEQDKLAKGRYRNQFTRPDMSVCLRGHSGFWAVTPNGTRYCKECTKLRAASRRLTIHGDAKQYPAA